MPYSLRSIIQVVGHHRQKVSIDHYKYVTEWPLLNPDRRIMACAKPIDASDD